MSFKKCVVCIAGDIREDIFAPDSWEDANIERWFKQRGMTLIWRDMNESVTHLVISRAAFKANHAAGKSLTLNFATKKETNVPFMASVRYVKKNRGGKKKAKIVTYDWLEDSFSANKPIQDISAYNPGKPRDIESMVAVYPKAPKTAKGKSADEIGTPVKKTAPEEEGPSQKVEMRQQDQTHPKVSTFNPSESERKEKCKPLAMNQASSSITSGPVVPEKQLVPTSGTIAQSQKGILKNKPQVKARPAIVSDAGPGLSWEARNKPRVFRDKTDQFRYRIELTHKEKPGEKWILQLLEAPNVDKAFLFRAYQYNAKDKIDLREDRSPPSTFQATFKLFTTSFRSKTRYAWDERLIIARGVQPGNWRYRLPATGDPTGKVPAEFDPGHPKYVKPKEPASIGQAMPGNRAIGRSASETPYERRPVFPDKNAMYDRPTNKKASKPLNTCDRAQRGKLKECYRSKARKSAAPISLKRRREEPLGPERRSKLTKTRNGRFKSSEFVEDSDSDTDPPKPSQHKPRL